jgi:meiotic recombination protein REC8, fungi type
MPWNITASIQGSRHGSSVPSLPRPFESVDLSARRPVASFGRVGHYFASSSPLAGRGLGLDPSGRNRHSSFSVPRIDSEDLDTLGDLDLNTYLGDEVHGDLANVGPLGDLGSCHAFEPGLAIETRTDNEFQRLSSTLDQDSRNFLEFMRNQVESLTPGIDVAEGKRPRNVEDNSIEKILLKEVTLSLLLPPETTTRAVATQALMHILTLATKDILAVRQETSHEVAQGENGTQEAFGEIILSLKGTFN